MTDGRTDTSSPPRPGPGEQVFTLRVNGHEWPFAAEPDMPLLWVLRDVLQLTGTKYGCGIARCGACTVLADDVAIRSCVTPVSRVRGKAITTIESQDAAVARVQRAWLDINVPQCGYCQSGQIMATVALLKGTAKPSDTEVDLALAGNLCRCGTYPRIRRAIAQLAGRRAQGAPVPWKSCAESHAQG